MKPKQWLEKRGYQNNALRIDENHRIDLYLSDVLEDYHVDKNKDLLNWLKSELQEETHDKLGKTINNYRSYKILLLTKIINRIKI